MGIRDLNMDKGGNFNLNNKGNIQECMVKKDTSNDYIISFEDILDVRVEITIPLGGTQQYTWASIPLTWLMEETQAYVPKDTLYTSKFHINVLNHYA